MSRSQGLLLLLLVGILPVEGQGQGAAVLVRVTADSAAVTTGTVQLIRRGEEYLRSELGRSGTALFTRLDVTEHDVRVQSPGYRTALLRRVVPTTGEALILEVVLEPAPYSIEPVSAIAQRVQIQRENTDFSTTVEERAIELLPTPHRITELVQLTPGARPDHVWGGSNFQANSYEIDGLSANHPGLGGAMIQPSTAWVDRIEVRGLGSGAEHGGFQGGQVNIVTKSGSNDFSAMIRTTLQNALTTASNLVHTEVGSEIEGRYDAEGEARGAIVQDRLFYYAAGTLVSERSRALNHLANVERRHSPFLETRQERKAFGKLTWTPGPQDEVNLSGGYLDLSADNYDLSGYEGPGATSTYSSPTWFSTATWRHAFGDRAVLDARFSRFVRDERQEPYGGHEVPGVRLYDVVPPYTSFGNAPFTLRSAPSNHSGSLTATFRLTTGEEEHLLKVGAEYTRGRFTDRRTRNGGMTWMPTRSAQLDPIDPATWPHPSIDVVPTQWGGEVHLDADVASAAAFAQTSISLGPLVLSPGVRWSGWKGWLDPRNGARFRAVADRAVDPRLGATVELARDGSMALKVHWGRYHQDMIAQMFDRAAGSDAFSNQEIWYWHGGAPTGPEHRFSAAERDSLAMLGLFTREAVVSLNETGPVADYRQPYIDQSLLGFEREFGSTVKLEALYVRRSNHDMIALVDRNRSSNYTVFERVRVIGSDGQPLPFNGGTVVLEEVHLPNWALADELRRCAPMPEICGPPPGLSFEDTLTLAWDPEYILTNAPDGTRRFDQFQLTVDVARARWGGSFSIAVTRLEGNLDNVSGYADPSLYGPGPYVRVNEHINSFGTLPNFSEREAKVSVWGVLPWELRAGLFWTYQSGDHYAARYRVSTLEHTYLANTDATRPPDDGTPQVGDTLSLAFFAPIEGHDIFVGPRGMWQLQRRAKFDIRLEKMFEFGPLDLGLSLDLFNVFGAKDITQVNGMVNHGQDYYGFLPPPPPGSGFVRYPDNQYYKAPLERVPPRALRIGLSAYY